MAQPESTPCPVALAKSRSRKRGIGSTGSTARRSTQSRAINNTTDAAINPLPHVVLSSNNPNKSATTDAVSSNAPA